MPLQHRLVRFIAVGSLAALLHWGVVVLLVEARGLAPLFANVAGWLGAFMLSFAGHQCWTFGDHGAPPARAAGRFFLVSAGGFALNEAAYALLLQATAWRYDGLLVIVLLAVAVITYWLSRRWAFAGRPAR